MICLMNQLLYWLNYTTCVS